MDSQTSSSAPVTGMHSAEAITRYADETGHLPSYRFKRLDSNQLRLVTILPADYPNSRLCCRITNVSFTEPAGEPGNYGFYGISSCLAHGPPIPAEAPAVLADRNRWVRKPVVEVVVDATAATAGGETTTMLVATNYDPGNPQASDGDSWGHLSISIELASMLQSFRADNKARTLWLPELCNHTFAPSEGTEGEQAEAHRQRVYAMANSFVAWLGCDYPFGLHVMRLIGQELQTEHGQLLTSSESKDVDIHEVFMGWLNSRLHGVTRILDHPWLRRGFPTHGSMPASKWNQLGTSECIVTWRSFCLAVQWLCDTDRLPSEYLAVITAVHGSLDKEEGNEDVMGESSSAVSEGSSSGTRSS
ncbi:hypothetical protein S7711_11154 [Stachybotrys chartarum IBT 7711]|uniref:Heterokaryon incompatibility domain-containing protein n=1 Tax=Stachybotrys chartarum (strain CBS 109288 / IBT 7711) TaxID=1280523 RepID=A0A084B7D1_STACB|nr:hypothetical protein S7711_11154 [Stachybotrys chartarum IBT 7711]